MSAEPVRRRKNRKTNTSLGIPHTFSFPLLPTHECSAVNLYMMTLKILFHMDVKWGTRKSPIKGNVKRNISPRARCRTFFVSRHSAQLFERALSIREWSSSGRVAYFVPACEALERFLFPVVPYPCCDGAIRF